MPLPLRYVEEIHARLQVRYGSSWTTKWAGIDQTAIVADWADQLDGMTPTGIRQALANLPHDFPPTAPAFRLLGVIREEREEFKALPSPAVNVEAARKVREYIRSVFTRVES